MSIQLKLDPYCEDCNRFEAETNSTALYSNSEMTHCETTITCTNRKKCKEIYEYLKAEERKRQTGEWIDTGMEEEWYARAYNCSLCGHTMVGTANYCQNCGARMVEPQESEDKENG